MTNAELEAILGDAGKRIEIDVTWASDEDHSPALEFRVDVISDAGYPLFVKGSFNAEAETLSFALIHRAVGRIYALDMGKDHHNPTCIFVGEKHKHRWSEATRDKEAYVPVDITAALTDPVGVWKQFCTEARITHKGRMADPPPYQRELR